MHFNNIILIKKEVNKIKYYNISINIHFNIIYLIKKEVNVTIFYSIRILYYL